MCHESTSIGPTHTIGVDKDSALLQDLHEADLITIFGQNPGTNHLRILSALEIAKQDDTRILAINLLCEAGMLRCHNPQAARGLAGHGITLRNRYLQTS